MKIKIIDDCISLEKQNNIIKESLNNKYFPWFYKQDITSLRAGNQGRPALSHYYVLKKITPKQGRLVIFDGDIEHTAKQPQDDVRCVINFDIQEQYEF